MNAQHEIRLALPGKGALESNTLTFLAECGLKVKRSNPRQYLAHMQSMPGIEVVFQRAADNVMIPSHFLAQSFGGFVVHVGAAQVVRVRDADAVFRRCRWR